MAPALAPHASTRFHLSAELAVLSALLVKSRAQHRSQLFLRHLVHVVRLSKALLSKYPASATAAQRSTPRSDRAADADADAASLALLAPLLFKLAPALIRAASTTTSMLSHLHFVPLQTLLLASYARLFAVVLGIAQVLRIEYDQLIAHGNGNGNVAVNVPAKWTIAASAAAQQRPDRIRAAHAQTRSEASSSEATPSIDLGLGLGERVQRVVPTYTVGPRMSPTGPSSGFSSGTSSGSRTRTESVSRPVSVARSAGASPSLGAGSSFSRLPAVSAPRPTLSTPPAAVPRPSPLAHAQGPPHEDDPTTTTAQSQPGSKVTAVAIPSSPSTKSSTKLSPKPVSTAPPPANVKAKTKKRRKRDAMDDIFGF